MRRSGVSRANVKTEPRSAESHSFRRRAFSRGGGGVERPSQLGERSGRFTSVRRRSWSVTAAVTAKGGTVTAVPRRRNGKRSTTPDASWTVHAKAANGEGSPYPRADGR